MLFGSPKAVRTGQCLSSVSAVLSEGHACPKAGFTAYAGRVFSFQETKGNPLKRYMQFASESAPPAHSAVVPTPAPCGVLVRPVKHVLIEITRCPKTSTKSQACSKKVLRLPASSSSTFHRPKRDAVKVIVLASLDYRRHYHFFVANSAQRATVAG